jgi:hypothetical protein
MLNCRFRLFISGLSSILFVINFAYNAKALDCYSDSPSVAEGRTVSEHIRPRDLADGEHQDLEKLLQSLAGKWSGTVEVESCRDIEDEVVTETEEYSVESKIDWRRSGQFSIKSSLSSEAKRSTHQDVLYLCLNRQRLSTVCNLAVSNIELMTVASDELVYVQKTSKRPNRLYGEVGSDKVRETITAIKKNGDSSFTLVKLIFPQGKLAVKETWQLDLK